MGLINLFKKLFGSAPQKVAAPERTANDFFAQREKERQERMHDSEQRLRSWIVAVLNEKGGLPFTWESGNDEAFVTFKDSTEAESDNFQELEEYIIDKLEIPDAGEFEMTGSGTVYLHENLIKAKYSSIMRGVIDYDEENDRSIYSEEEQDSGDRVLFAM
jgi:hypothetical protein